LVPSFFLQAVADYLDYDIENIAPVDGSSLVLKDFPVGVNGTLRDVEVPLDGNGNLVVNLAGKFNGENYPQSYSAWDLLQAEGQPDFAGKLVFLADTSVERASAGDFSPVPLESVFPRSYVLSNAASSILNGEFIQPVSNVFSTAFTLVATALLSMVLVVVCWKTSTMVLSLTALGVIVLYLAGILCFFLFGGWLLPTVTVPISLVAVFLFSSGWQRREHQELALVDGLTGLYNRRWLDQFLLRQMSRARVSGESLSIAMIDIDHFKNFNDTYGHQVGDFVLVSIADCLRNSLRPTDLTARYGGEEFTVILPQTSGENAMIAAERVRESVSSLNLVTPSGLELPPLTISIGVSELTTSESMEQLIEAADRALYTAKESGRNRVHNATV
jgi:diguanylate cyclase (GGDEF)-like protein